MKRLMSNTMRILWLMMVFTAIPCKPASAAELSKSQQARANTVAQVCVANYSKYGVLPSTCLSQGFIESQLGRVCSINNLWGISSNGYAGFSSLQAGTLKYLQTINNGYYDGAPFASSTRSQLIYIIRGGYCQGAGTGYVNNCMWAVREFNFEKYDKDLVEHQKDLLTRISKGKSVSKTDKEYLKRNKSRQYKAAVSVAKANKAYKKALKGMK